MLRQKRNSDLSRKKTIIMLVLLAILILPTLSSADANDKKTISLKAVCYESIEKTNPQLPDNYPDYPTPVVITKQQKV